MDANLSDTLAILYLNTSKPFWGSDADTFNPDRFLKASPGILKSLPGVWGDIMTFGGGNRSCM